MVVLNLRYQRDTPTGMVDVHAFVADQEEEGNFLVYCRLGHDENKRVVQTEAMVIDCIHKILDRLPLAVH